ncbi:MAG: hypothetical protein MUD15_00695 [Desulfobacterota bacterium]|jgi:hypothetical protein|nr:hypothetical protein [Thermodesulfobacteriota bacterium]
MTDKNLLEDDIIDLTDLLEEGHPPEKPLHETPRKKVVTEPDSFDLGKEISMDFDVSIEEIEHESPALAEAMPLEPERKEQDLSPVTEEIKDIAKETLGDIGAEIDMAMQDKLEEVTLTKNEEEVLLQEGPVEEILSDPEKGSLAAVDESRPAEVAPEPEPLPAGVQQQYGVSSTVTTEAIVDAVVSEFRKDLPILLEGIVRPVVQELLQEIVASTRQEIPGIVEKVIREEIERLKKL